MRIKYYKCFPRGTTENFGTYTISLQIVIQINNKETNEDNCESNNLPNLILSIIYFMINSVIRLANVYKNYINLLTKLK